MNKVLAKRLAKKAREKELFLLFKEFMREVEELEFKEYILKLEDKKSPKLFSDESLKVRLIY
ncbi:hypothetical protein A8M26_08395 [Campylobacter coli]|uniref:hypothetical protein n=1 Tax=Campylobacter coli TaxID=195 RepID=UPI000931E935|nr:hypothetical protein [Campylobacter coli]EDN2796577.1 hypothetical protein [Campylobacter jejuni]EAC1597173.1 hypothetical protein [Campylobacter coli]EAI2583322.1 hypothetical protein [Campylobacter coli]EAI6799123.1 hypothetical protein [Campylobacter coli]EAI8768012.1 hypothetical protein [Campylobacter coli]